MVAPYIWKMVLNIMLERGTVLIDSFNKHLFNTLHVLGTAVNKSRHHPSLPHRAARIPKLPWMEYGRGGWSFTCILSCTSVEFILPPGAIDFFQDLVIFITFYLGNPK